MRLDLFLKTSRLVLRRTVAKELCDLGSIELNGRKAKASSEVAPGQILRIHHRNRMREVEILAIPAGRVLRKESADVYRLLREQEEISIY